MNNGNKEKLANEFEMVMRDLLPVIKTWLPHDDITVWVEEIDEEMGLVIVSGRKVMLRKDNVPIVSPFYWPKLMADDVEPMIRARLAWVRQITDRTSREFERRDMLQKLLQLR